MKGEIPMSDNIIRFTNGDDGVFAHVETADGKHYGVNLEHLAVDASDEFNLVGKFFQAVIDRVKAGGDDQSPKSKVDDEMPAGFYADMLAIEVGCTGAVSSEFIAGLDGERWLVTAERIGCRECEGGAS